ncbi:diguanylate cyclase (GGDEF) domain-containing protein [Colwellia chukchiensis]|uniref:diguanylate cyclase n=1 Tax=Colwellia chukchiensis TaxID=641665 RepID=A0A1H7P9F9_9GAMM|nr:GGDEF domain-containing protein [Colwellia chukchiensis]SEL32084.1 diguanylate cyclase (GGDEF) domain-containing protein [Colwellia chukchiensis]
MLKLLIFLPLLLPTWVHAQVLADIATPMQWQLSPIFLGSGLMLVLLCFASAHALRSKSMAILALFFFFKCLAVLVIGGESLFAIFTPSVALLKSEAVLLNHISIIIFFVFTMSCFALPKNSKGAVQLLLFLALCLLLLIPSSYFFDFTAQWLVIQLPTSISLLVLLYISKQMPAKYARMATIFTLTLVFQLLFNILAYIHYFGEFSVEARFKVDVFAFWLMSVMIAYLIARKYHCQRLDEHQAQQNMLQNLQASEAAQQALLKLQQASHEQLEIRVQERTLELNIALQELAEVNQVLAEKNTLDELSGLYNRRYYEQKILAEFRRSRRNLTPLSMVLIDIDHFKAVNDNFGHLAGDACIVAVADKIKSLLRRSSDVGCRYGGEEFCLILAETDAKGALSLAQEVCQNIRQQQVHHNDQVIHLTVSCGVITYQQEPNVSPQVMFECVDKALYQAKQAGRDQVQVGLLSAV